MHVIVFSKDRPLQLHGYLASLQHNTGVADEQIAVVYVDDPSYRPLIDEKPRLRWAPEKGGFHATLAGLIDAMDDDELVLFGCDDVVYFRQADLAAAAHVLHADATITGFSLRLGSNVPGFEAIKAEGKRDGGLIVWTTDGHSGHWNYPFEVMGSIFRAGLVKQILEVGGPFRGPNDFEGVGMRLCCAPRVPWQRVLSRKLRGKPPIKGDRQRVAFGKLAMFDRPNCCAAQDVNLVQSQVANQTHGSDEHDIDTLKEKFLAGYRFDWRSMQGITPNDCFIGDRYWKLVKPAG